MAYESDALTTRPHAQKAIVMFVLKVSATDVTNIDIVIKKVMDELLMFVIDLVGKGAQNPLKISMIVRLLDNIPLTNSKVLA